MENFWDFGKFQNQNPSGRVAVCGSMPADWIFMFRWRKIGRVRTFATFWLGLCRCRRPAHTVGKSRCQNRRRSSRAMEKIFRERSIRQPHRNSRSRRLARVNNLSDRLRNQIVISVADNFDAGEFANWHSALRRAHINAAVNIRRIRLAAADQIVDGG